MTEIGSSTTINSSNDNTSSRLAIYGTANKKQTKLEPPPLIGGLLQQAPGLVGVRRHITHICWPPPPTPILAFHCIFVASPPLCCLVSDATVVLHLPRCSPAALPAGAVTRPSDSPALPFWMDVLPHAPPPLPGGHACWPPLSRPAAAPTCSANCCRVSNAAAVNRPCAPPPDSSAGCARPACPALFAAEK